jgi:formiminoglutamase
MKSRNNNFELFEKGRLASNIHHGSRPDEPKYARLLSEPVQNSRYVILGISECIGPAANFGRKGSEQGFSAFLTYFTALPKSNFSIDFLGDICFVGSFPKDISTAQGLVEELDDLVERVLKERVVAGQIPIIIGGGHNNALPIMRWASNHRPLNKVINIDAHFDVRPTTVRHSGNAFSSAIEEGILEEYVALGIDPYATSDVLWDFVYDFDVKFVPFVEYLQGKELKEDLVFYTQDATGYGLEIDLDCMENMPTSAQSPSGFHLNDVRKAINSLTNKNAVYLHLCEGAPTNEQEQRTVGKSLCYLVLDFISVMERL